MRDLIVGAVMWFGLTWMLKAALLRHFRWAPTDQALVVAFAVNFFNCAANLFLLFNFGNLLTGVGRSILLTMLVEVSLIVILAPGQAGRGVATILLSNVLAYLALGGLFL